MGVLGFLSVLLAAVGLYSVMAYAVNERRQEIAIRMALGARPLDVVAMVLRQSMLLALGGLLLGSIAALTTGRILSGMLFGISAADPRSFGNAALLISLVALLAAFIPGHRATRVTPMNALRDQ
jgi:putative ABC transport system permease protein